ncbi:hypothetical protein EHYA_07398 [Embleya hyalina]|uniref:Uncharacterized protein n=1 Tax=Embleya hyalina TaxID=516124 RepID=A0A401YYF6_9ACTN|nr:hypothetical protein EHYA_07398 [Embleya hyalina]
MCRIRPADAGPRPIAGEPRAVTQGGTRHNRPRVNRGGEVGERYVSPARHIPQRYVVTATTYRFANPQVRPTIRRFASEKPDLRPTSDRFPTHESVPHALNSTGRRHRSRSPAPATDACQRLRRPPFRIACRRHGTLRAPSVGVPPPPDPPWRFVPLGGTTVRARVVRRRFRPALYVPAFDRVGRDVQGSAGGNVVRGSGNCWLAASEGRGHGLVELGRPGIFSPTRPTRLEGCSFFRGVTVTTGRVSGWGRADGC